MEINGKPRIVIWFFSPDQRFIGNAVNILERQFNGVDIVGVTARYSIEVTDNRGRVLPFISLQELTDQRGYDILLLAGAKQFGISEVTKFARAINLDTDKLLGDWIVCIPGFTLKKYRQLQRSQLSIFVRDCFGGLISNTLGLPFRAPFVNMFIDENEYIRFLRSPRVYMEENLVFQGTKFEKMLKFDYPIYTLGNVSWHMNHYRNFDEAVAKWNERKQRINWYNMFVAMHTEDPKVLEQFDELPYGKKVCFVPFKSDLDSAWYINPEMKKDEPFIRIVHLFARGDAPAYYDMFDMLLYGKKTPLIEM